MPELKCTVQTCTHNKNFYCDLDQIVVGGSGAKRSGAVSYTHLDVYKRQGRYYLSIKNSRKRKEQEDCAKCGVFLFFA